MGTRGETSAYEGGEHLRGERGGEECVCGVYDVFTRHIILCRQKRGIARMPGQKRGNTLFSTPLGQSPHLNLGRKAMEVPGLPAGGTHT